MTTATATAAAMPRTRTFTQIVRCSFDSACAYLADAARYGEWAAGLARTPPHPVGPGRWRVLQDGGSAELRFVPLNPLGVFDHWVQPEGTAVEDSVHVPLRVVRLSDDWCEVQLTLIAGPHMDDESFAADGSAIAQDLAALRARLEAGG